MKIKTTELQREALDRMVAHCVGIEIVSVKHGRATFIDPADDGALNEMPINYSTDWAQGGPIIEREKIILDIWGDEWLATRIEDPAISEAIGPTPLIAAMRCYVASKLGDEVEVPDESSVDSDKVA